MKRRNLEDRLVKKQAAWVQRTALALNISEADAIALLATPRQQSIRLNPIRQHAITTLTQLRTLGWHGKAYEWMPQGYTVESDIKVLRDSDLVQSGKVFIQNAASWLPALALNPQPYETILDVCAAPGGKTSHIAALSNNQARIYANDNSRARLAKLRANTERMGAEVEMYTLYDARFIARKLEGQLFDKILLDAPCSGEGLMNIRDSKSLTTWSVAHIKRLQQLQKTLITQSWQLLKPGGTLVYSTCTMAPEENEAIIDYLLRSQDNATVTPLTVDVPNVVPAVITWNNKVYSKAVEGCLRLQPSQHIEAFFVCKLQKTSQA